MFVAAGALTAAGLLACQMPANAAGPHHPEPTPSPDPWRNLPLAEASQSGNVEVTGAFAAARRDGRGAVACVSFKNLSPKVATEIIFEFPLLNAQGVELGKLTLDRKGEFSPQIQVTSFERLMDWQEGAPGPRTRIENCTERESQALGAAVLEARLAGYRVVRVRYDDGTTWPPL